MAEWLRVYETLRDAIASGELVPGSQLPSEFEVSATHNVSRNTVRRAYLALSQDGLIRSVNGRGAFVMPSGITYEVDATSRFGEALEAQGVRSSVQVLEQREAEADTGLASGLDVPLGHPLLRMTSVILGDDVPFILLVRHIRTDLVDDLQHKLDAAGSLTTVAREAGLGQLRRVSRTVGARLPSKQEAEQLNCPANAPVLAMTSIGRVDDGQRLEYTSALMNGRLVRLSFHRS